MEEPRAGDVCPLSSTKEQIDDCGCENSAGLLGCEGRTCSQARTILPCAVTFVTSGVHLSSGEGIRKSGVRLDVGL